MCVCVCVCVCVCDNVCMCVSVSVCDCLVSSRISMIVVYSLCSDSSTSQWGGTFWTSHKHTFHLLGGQYTHTPGEGLSRGCVCAPVRDITLCMSA